jgi:hypothetical protein
MRDLPPSLLRRLPKRRHRAATGDIFASVGWIFGRVVSVTACYSPWPERDGTLMYFSWPPAASPNPPERLLVNQLLFPPVVAVRSLWSNGVVMHVLNRPIEQNERLSKHCFEYGGRVLGPRYFDENADRLPGRVEPCGKMGMFLEEGIDLEIRNACQHKMQSSPSLIPKVR